MPLPENNILFYWTALSRLFLVVPLYTIGKNRFAMRQVAMP